MVPDAALVVAPLAEPTTLPLRFWNTLNSDTGLLCGLSTQLASPTLRGGTPANRQIRIARRIIQSAAECNGPT
jgi:hypothetical protein